MANSTLDQWDNSHDNSKKPLIISDEHAHYLYEQSYGRMVERRYDGQIEAYLEDEKAEKAAHKEYTERNYIRIGGN